MDSAVANAFARIVELAQATFSQVEAEIDITPQRAILRLKATYGHYRFFATELYSDQQRKYQYYLLRDNWVEAGFDNHPDPRAIRLKYGTIGADHAGEYVPHLHRNNKTELSLTDEIDFETFITWLKQTIPSD